LQKRALLDEDKMRLALVSPFLDRQHGTERCIVEQIERFLKIPDTEIHIYAQSVEDLGLLQGLKGPRNGLREGKLVWHRIPRIPGPHLVNFVWWYFANQGLRWFHKTFRSLRYDLVFSPGINCADADAIVVHIVFSEFFRVIRADLRLLGAPLRSWPVLLHRMFYYRLIVALENRIYRNGRIALAAVSDLTCGEIAEHFGRRDVPVILDAVDLSRFNSSERLQRRAAARRTLGFEEEGFVILLIGNDWKKKGLPSLLQALASEPGIPWRLLIVGRDERAPFLTQMDELRIRERVRFMEPSPDVMQFMAAADVYAGPSIHDAFSMPPLEAMACGLPVITSAQAGVAQLISNGCDGFVLDNARDSLGLAAMLRELYEKPELRCSMGQRAAKTAGALTWERNAQETLAFLMEALQRKNANLAK
jgi:glycosyltransferase involved in cell wall biosynthesis